MKDMTFKNYLKKNVTLINLELKDLFDLWSNEVVQISPRLKSLITVLQDGSQGGKRIRGVLVTLGYALAAQKKLSSKEEKNILRIAVAYEIFQTSILAHDDIIDKSELRRGKPTLYHQLGNNHYGISQTISIGDLGFFMAYKIIAESLFLSENKNKAIAFFSNSITQTVLGQMLDVEFAHQKIKITDDLLEEILKVYKLKTAYYTFVAPLSLGAILGGVDKKVLENIKTFGENVGVLFQLHDDSSDIFPESKKTNEEIGVDIKEGKMTLLYAKAMQNATAAQHHVLSEHYGKALIEKNTISEIQKVFRDTGALDYTLTLVDTFENAAREIIPSISKDKETQQMFHEIVDYVSGKEKSHD
jgi:geranylgeranyl diphosphate synthase type I